MFINTRGLERASRNVGTQHLIDVWDSNLSQLIDISENLIDKDSKEKFMSACGSLIRRIEDEVLMEQKQVTQAKEQLKLLEEAKTCLLKNITELQGEAL